MAGNNNQFFLRLTHSLKNVSVTAVVLDTVLSTNVQGRNWVLDSLSFKTTVATAYVVTPAVSPTIALSLATTQAVQELCSTIDPTKKEPSTSLYARVAMWVFQVEPREDISVLFEGVTVAAAYVAPLPLAGIFLLCGGEIQANQLF
eukprot:PhF_6_TR44149/c0_g3_i1/m.67531